MIKLKYISKKEVLSFDWQTFSNKMKRMFEFAQKNSVVAINADRWEEFIHVVLRNMGMKYKGEPPKWVLGSHRPGADIWIDQFSISAKSGNIQSGCLTLSSYRLTRFSNLGEMKEFIDSPEGKNFDVYLCSARINNNNGSRTYRVYLIDSDIFHAKNLDWEDMHLRDGITHSGWKGLNKKGIKVEIRRKMSNQLWISIPLKMCNELFDITISGKDLGSEEEKPLTDN